MIFTKTLYSNLLPAIFILFEEWEHDIWKKSVDWLMQLLCVYFLTL